MLATQWSEPFDDPQWWFEVKWDGYRVLAHSVEGVLTLKSRRGNDLTGAFPEIAPPVSDRRLVLDGEIVVFGSDGTPSFHGLQQRNGLTGAGARHAATHHPATVVVFDVLVDGDLVVDEPLERRRERLERVELGTMVADQPVRGEGTVLWAAVMERGLEGIVAKRSGSIYRPGRRSADWRKVPWRRSMNAVVAGFLPGGGARASEFGSILVGLYDDDGLRYIGAVGSGFDSRDLASMQWALSELATVDCPFVDPSRVPPGARWVQPGIVVRVEYKEMTPDGRMRAPVFKGAAEVAPADVTFASELG